MTTDALEASSAFMEAAGRSTTLYSYAAVWDEVRGLLDDLDPAQDAEQIGQLEALLDTLELGGIKEKAEAIAGLSVEMEYRAAARRAEAKRLDGLAESEEKQSDRLRAYLLRHMAEMDIPLIQTVRFKISRRLNPPKAVILDETLIPDEFWRQPAPPPKKPDLTAIKAAFKDGIVVPGTNVVQGERLEVK